MNKKKSEKPCLNCGKYFVTTRTNRICQRCTDKDEINERTKRNYKSVAKYIKEDSWERWRYG